MKNETTISNFEFYGVNKVLSENKPTHKPLPTKPGKTGTNKM